MDLRRRLEKIGYSCPDSPPPHLSQDPICKRESAPGRTWPLIANQVFHQGGFAFAQLQGSQGPVSSFLRIQADVGAGGRGTLLKISRPPGKGPDSASSSPAA